MLAGCRRGIMLDRASADDVMKKFIVTSQLCERHHSSMTEYVLSYKEKVTLLSYICFTSI